MASPKQSRQARLAMELDLERRLALERARGGLLNFIRHTKPNYQVNWHHRLMAKYLNGVVDGTVTRLIICMPPRHGKSEQVSVRFPAYLFGRKPDSQVIAASYNATLAAKMNRAVQRVIDSPAYAELFPKTYLNSSNVRTTAQGSWLRNSDEFEIVGHQGFYRSAGVGGSATGYGATVGIIDDPVKNREEADSQVYRERNWEWYLSTFYSRLEKNGAIIVCACMTGDTPVLMANGEERPLAEVRPGDQIATYDDGKIGTSVIKNWINHGPDSVYEIRTMSGTRVRANRRHPFLVSRGGELKWVRLRDLKLSDKMTRVTAPTRASLAKPRDAASQPDVSGCAWCTTAEPGGLLGTGRHPPQKRSDGATNCSSATSLWPRSTSASWIAKSASALSARTRQFVASICPKGGTASSVSTTTTLRAPSEACSATSATCSLSTPAPRRCSCPPSTICDPIVAIELVGQENVFDIEVERTENFIANGLVSHNTRWHEDDLIGRLLTQARENPKADQWTVVNLPAIAEQDRMEGDPRQPGEALWPEKKSLAELSMIRAPSERNFASLYQQRPAPAEGAIIKVSWFRYWKTPPEAIEKLIVSADLNGKDKERSDFTVLTVWAKAGPNFYLLDMVRARMGWIAQKAAMRRVSSQYPDLNAIYIEDASNGIPLIQEARLEIPGIVAVTPRGSKLTRLEAVSGLFEGGNVFIPDPDMAGYQWSLDVVREICTFPSGANDDIVDSVSQALSQLKNRAREYNFDLDVMERSNPLAGLGALAD